MNLVTKILGHKQEYTREASPEGLCLDVPASTHNISDESYHQNFVVISGGEFTMGSPASELLRGSDETQHQVWVSTFSPMQICCDRCRVQEICGSVRLPD
jgi:formylglycine-generating enzyme required for sulfatase activity